MWLVMTFKMAMMSVKGVVGCDVRDVANYDVMDVSGYDL